MTAPVIDRSRVTELRKAAETKALELEGLAGDWKDEGGKLVISSDQRDAYLKAHTEAKDIESLLKAAEDTAGLRGYLDTPETKDAPVGALYAAGQAQAMNELKSLGQLFIESSEFKAAKDAEDWRTPQFGIQMKTDRSLYSFESKDVYGGGYPGMVAGTVTLPAMGRLETRPIIDIKRRQSHVRDLFPSATTQAALIYGVRETGWTNNAAQVSQRTAADGTAATGASTDVFGIKPKSDIALEPYTIPIATIAHLMDAHRNILADEPRLQDFIDRRLRQGLMFAEDVALLWGTGGAERITGIMVTDGIQVYPPPGVTTTTDKRSLQLRRASTRVMLAEYEPTGVVLHPLDWEQVETETDTTGALFVAVSVAVGAEKKVWRLNVVETPAMMETRYLLGAFGNGAQYYEREQTNVGVSTENRDNWERNVVTFRSELRGALCVDRPESFISGTFLTPA
jgi:HK97 family phage major capsid protein